MKKFLKNTLLLLLSCMATQTFADPLMQTTMPHIWHNIAVQSGNWAVRLQVINEAERAWFVLPDGITKINAFDVTKESPKKVGLMFDNSHKPDFDLAYTITLVEKGSHDSRPNMTSKSCIFLVTATGPAKPDIITHAYNGADCSWKGDDSGEDFFAK